MKTTPKFTIGNVDFFKGALLAAALVIYKGLKLYVNAGHLPDVAAFSDLLTTGMEAGMLYLFKQYFTTSDGILGGVEPLTLPAAQTQPAAQPTAAVA